MVVVVLLLLFCASRSMLMNGVMPAPAATNTLWFSSPRVKSPTGPSSPSVSFGCSLASVGLTRPWGCVRMVMWISCS